MMLRELQQHRRSSARGYSFREDCVLLSRYIRPSAMGEYQGSWFSCAIAVLKILGS